MSVNTNCELDLTCPICMQQLDLPVMLWPCAHIFCHDCLRQWEPSHSKRLSDQSTFVLCPSCSQLGLVQEGVDVLPRNRSLNNSVQRCHDAPTLSRVEVQRRLREARNILEQRQGDIVVSLTAIRNRSTNLPEEGRRKKEEVRYLLRTVQDELNKRRIFLEDQIDDVREQAMCYCEHRLDQLNESMRLLANFAEGLSELMNLSFGSCDEICEVELTEFLDGVEQVVLSTVADPKEPIPIATPDSFRLPGIDICVLVDNLVLDTDMPIPPRGYYHNRGSHKMHGPTVAMPCHSAYGHTAPCQPGAGQAPMCHTATCAYSYGHKCNICGVNRQWNNSEDPCLEGVIIDRFCDVTASNGLNNSSDGSDNAASGVQVDPVIEQEKGPHCLATEDDAVASCKMASLANVSFLPSQSTGPEPVVVQGLPQSHLEPAQTREPEVGTGDAAGSGAQAVYCDQAALGNWLQGPEAGKDTMKNAPRGLPPRDLSVAQSSPRRVLRVARRRVHGSCPLHGQRHRPARHYTGPASTDTYTVTVQEKPAPSSELASMANAISLRTRSGSLPPDKHPLDYNLQKKTSLTEVTVEEATGPTKGPTLTQVNTLEQNPIFRNYWSLNKNRSSKITSSLPPTQQLLDLDPQKPISITEITLEATDTSRASTLNQVNTLEQNPTFRNHWALNKNHSSRSVSSMSVTSTGADHRSRSHARPVSRKDEKNGIETTAADVNKAEVKTGSIENPQKHPSEEARPQAGHELSSLREIPDILPSSIRHESCTLRIERQRSTPATASAHVDNKPRRQALLPPLLETNGVSKKDSLVALTNKPTNNTASQELAVDSFCHTCSSTNKRKKLRTRRINTSKGSLTSDSGSSIGTKYSRHWAECDREQTLVPLTSFCAPPPEKLPISEDEHRHMPLEVECKVVVTDRVPLLNLKWNSCPGADWYKVSTHDLGMAGMGGAMEGGATPKGVFLVEVFTTDTKATLQHGQFEHTYAVVVAALSPQGQPLARSHQAIVRIPRMIHFEHLHFDPQGCHADVVVDATLHGAFRRNCSATATEERCTRPLHTLPGSLACPALPSHAVSENTIYWECEIHLKVVLVGQSCESICSVGLCQEAAVDQEDNLATNSRSLCVSLFVDDVSVAMRFWDGWKRVWMPTQCKVQVMELARQREASFHLGFLLHLPRRSLVLVDVHDDTVLHKFQLPKREVTWIPTACLSDQNMVTTTVTWRKPRALPGCLLDLIG